MTDKHIDPVCGMTVDPARAAGSSEHDGKTIYFCSKGCKAKFDAAPEQYVGRAVTARPADPKGPPHVTSGSKWTCPMHPEVVQDGPGSCPICGMALEPLMP